MIFSFVLLNCASVSTTVVEYDTALSQGITCRDMRDCFKEAAKECPTGYVLQYNYPNFNGIIIHCK
jgi:ferredoxin